MKIAFYIANFNDIGGIESWIYYIGKTYGKNRDIIVFYVGDGGSQEQLDRLRPMFKLRRFYHQKVKCDLVIFPYTVSNDILLCFEAKRIQFIHACYSVAYGVKTLSTNPLIDEYIAVSQTVADDFYKLTGHMPRVIYNPIYIEKPRRVLKIISATRISDDKGSIWERMKILAKKLNDAKLPFIWLVFTNSKRVSDVPNVYFVPANLKITDYIADADYLAQFSKTEGDCLSIKESLSVNTPVLCTNFAAALENGVVDGVNGYIFDMDMSNIDVDKIYNEIPKFEGRIKKSEKEWKELLGPERKIQEKEEMVKVRCVTPYGFQDYEENKFRKRDSVWTCTRERAEHLEDFIDPKSLTHYHLVDIIE